MAAWTVIPCLLTLRSEFNAVNPTRDKGADGTIGDSAHTSTSDHTPDEDSDFLRDHDADSKNEVHALDIDSSGPWPSTGWFNEAIEGIRERERARWLDPNDKCRLKYIIWNKRIASQSSDFEWRAYSGSDPHTNHAHFSGRYETVCENDTSPWGVDDMALSADDKTWIANTIKTTVAAAVDDFLTVKTGDKTYPGRTVAQFITDLHGLRDYLKGDAAGTVNSGITQTSPVRVGIDAAVFAAQSADRIERALAAMAAKPVITKEVVRAAMLDIIDGVASGE